MKTRIPYAFLSACLLFSFQLFGQSYHTINLDERIAKNKEFSGLAISGNLLFLLPELHGKDGLIAEKIIYCLDLKEIRSNIKHKSTERVSIKKQYPIEGLTTLLENKKIIDEWEGFESLVIINNTFYFTIETSDGNAKCYLVKGFIGQDKIVMDTALQVLPRFKMFQNVGFESMAYYKKELLCFFEYNAPDIPSRGLRFGPDLQQKLPPMEIPPVYLRMTDATVRRKRQLFAINYYWGGEYEYYINHNDQAVKAAIPDLQDSALNNKPFVYGRIIKLEQKHHSKKWKQVMALPPTHNWEGLACFKKGFLVISDGNKNDKQGTELIYIR